MGRSSWPHGLVVGPKQTHNMHQIASTCPSITSRIRVGYEGDTGKALAMEGVLVSPPTGIPCSQQAKSTNAGHDPYSILQCYRLLWGSSLPYDALRKLDS